MVAPERLLRATRRASGPALTLAAIGLAEGLTDFVVEDTLPLKGAIYTVVLGTVVYATFAGGWFGGLLSAAVASVYAYYDYLTFGDGLTAASDRLLLATSVTTTIVGMAVLVGALRTRAERVASRALAAERVHAIELGERNAALQESNATLEAFTYVVSHDLKEPIRALDAFSRELDEEHRDGLDDEGRELAERIRRATQRLRRLVDDLLDYSRAARLRPDELERLRVDDVLRSPECAARFVDALVERRGTLEIEADATVRASRVGLAQVLGNLVLNAIRHNPKEEPSVRIRALLAPDGWVEVAVDDDGPGFPPPLREALELPRAEARRAMRGGFGLLIAREAAEKMGGSLRAATCSDLGGASVRLRLPAG